MDTRYTKCVKLSTCVKLIHVVPNASTLGSNITDPI